MESNSRERFESVGEGQITTNVQYVQRTYLCVCVGVRDQVQA